MRILSIDWDYFVEEDPMLDWGHREAEFFLNQIWHFRREQPVFDANRQFELNGDGTVKMLRRDLSELAPFRGHETDILSLPCLRGNYKIATAESHLSILQFLKDEKNLSIINIDAHHDIFYSNKNFSSPSFQPDCGSWAGYLISKGQVESYTQIYPAWRKKEGFPEGSETEVTRWARKKLDKRMKISWDEPIEVVNWRSVDMVFVCRSGCWVPPEYDDRFNEFCRKLGANVGLETRQVERDNDLTAVA